MTENYVIERKICPKCKDVLKKLAVSPALPTYIGKPGRTSDDKTPAISTTEVWTVEMYHCPTCRFVELYAI